VGSGACRVPSRGESRSHLGEGTGESLSGIPSATRTAIYDHVEHQLALGNIESTMK
jgi:hypothetical protein